MRPRTRLRRTALRKRWTSSGEESVPAASVSSAVVSCSGVGLWAPQKRGSVEQTGWEHWRPEGERCSQRAKASLDSDLKRLNFILELLGGTPCFWVRDVVKEVTGSRQVHSRQLS